MHDDVLPCTNEGINDDALSALNRSPLSFLANCGVRHGESFGNSFLQAQDLLDRHGTSRRIGQDHACNLCEAMRQWAGPAL